MFGESAADILSSFFGLELLSQRNQESISSSLLKHFLPPGALYTAEPVASELPERGQRLVLGMEFMVCSSPVYNALGGRKCLRRLEDTYS